MNFLFQTFDYRRNSLHVWLLLLVVLLCSCTSNKNLELGDPAPQFEVKTLDGEPIRFDPASGKIHIIYFWAAWCPQCEDDIKLMDKLYVEWKKRPDKYQFLAVNSGQPNKRIREFVKRMKTSFPIYKDRDTKVAQNFGIKALPTCFITDQKGIVRHIILGWADEKSLLAEIDKIDLGVAQK